MIKSLLICGMVMAGSLQAADAVVRPRVRFLTTLYENYSDYKVGEDGWSPLRELLGSQSFHYKYERLRALMHDHRFKLSPAISDMVTQVVQGLMREHHVDAAVVIACQALLSQVQQRGEAQLPDTKEEGVVVDKDHGILLFVDQGPLSSIETTDDGSE
ncbi:MAG: hypothetical protein QG604_862 [Candidatus Dependentiae bacterium]|nr:hypothetical protein [Candidatus Dependentiae bacterium]